MGSKETFFKPLVLEEGDLVSYNDITCRVQTPPDTLGKVMIADVNNPNLQKTVHRSLVRFVKRPKKN